MFVRIPTVFVHSPEVKRTKDTYILFWVFKLDADSIMGTVKLQEVPKS